MNSFGGWRNEWLAVEDGVDEILQHLHVLATAAGKVNLNSFVAGAAKGLVARG